MRTPEQEEEEEELLLGSGDDSSAEFADSSSAGEDERPPRIWVSNRMSPESFAREGREATAQALQRLVAEVAQDVRVAGKATWFKQTAAYQAAHAAWARRRALRWLLVALTVVLAAAVLYRAFRCSLASSAFEAAEIGGCLATVKSAVSDDEALIKSTSASGMTLLHCAASAGDGELVDWLLSHGSVVLSRTPLGVTALHFAARSGSIDAIRALLVARSDPNSPADDGTVPLQWATTDEAIKLLKAHGAKLPNARKIQAR